MQYSISELVKEYLKRNESYKALRIHKESAQYFEGLEGYPLAEAIRLYSDHVSGRVWALCATEEEARQLATDLDAASHSYIYLTSSGKKLYSSWEGSQREYEQTQSLSTMVEKPHRLVVTHLRAFVSPVVSLESIRGSKVRFQKGELFKPVEILETLAQGGYYRSPSTTMPGEFSIHGEVLDIFPYSFTSPIRLYADWDHIEKISSFDPNTQETIKHLSHVEFSLLYEQEKPLLGSIGPYINDDDFMFFLGLERLESSYHSLESEAKALYRDAFIIDRSSLKPYELLYDFPTLVQECTQCAIKLDVQGQKSEAHTFDIDGPRSYFGNFVMLKEELANLLKGGYRIAIYAASKLQKERLSSMLSQFKDIYITEEQLSGGFSIPDIKLIVLCDHEIFGRRKQVVKTLHKVQSSPLDSFVDLHEGDYVVHVNYGVGQFQKIDRISMSGKERDYIKILYAQQETLFVPIEQANLIQRYIGSAGGQPRLDTLGGQGWESKKAKARKSAELLASRLIGLYARRKSSTGFPFPKDTDWQLEFEASFPFEETEDQIRCIEEVKLDMESPHVMDRLICGDVGYGKTEIAFRAAFKAVMAAKQVAFLAPTTILAEQHYTTLLERLGSFPVRVEILSRMVSKKKQKEVLQQLKEGSIDILVGTHRILQKDVVYKDLGLLVIDEEQRFGVKDKERVKELKHNIDSLALSATPIPRTLYMSLLNIRDMSLLTSAPIQRRPIKTIIQEFDIETIVKAITHEVERGGQVYYLHNRIETLNEVVAMLQKELPYLLIESIHGQQDASSVEDVMRRFIYQGIQVLVSTTLIENGIDIPNVNTIIIDRADNYGVSQLYQLRGRVGRSDQEAFAYLFYPKLASMNEMAIKRLKIISEHTDLGSGFKIALKDMEMRGTGNLLGKEQSGQLASVGLDMYLRILDEEIVKLTKEGVLDDSQDLFLELDYSGFIPNEYISEASLKFEIYKKIASVDSDVALQALRGELESRFGTPPEEVNNLLYIAELKIIGKSMNISHLKERNGQVTITFNKVKDIAIDKVMELIRLSNGNVKVDPRFLNVLRLNTDAISLKDKSLFIVEILQRIA